MGGARGRVGDVSIVDPVVAGQGCVRIYRPSDPLRRGVSLPREMTTPHHNVLPFYHKTDK